MKKGIFVLLSFMLLLVGCSSAKSSENLLEQIKSNGKIVIGTNSGYPPYEFFITKEDGTRELSGVDIDLGNMIASELGVEAEFVDMDFEALVPSLNALKLDIILAGMVNTEERSQAVSFSPPYNESALVGIAKKENIQNVNTAEKLNGKKIAVQVATTQKKAADSVEGAEVLSLPTIPDIVMHVTSGKADVLFVAEVSAKSIVNENPELEMFDINVDYLEDGASIAYPKNEVELQEYIDMLVEKWVTDGTVKALFDKYTEYVE